MARNLRATEIAGVEIRTFAYAVALAGREPRTLDGVGHAIAFAVATMLVRRRIGPDEASLPTPDDAELTARSIRPRWAAVALVLTDGRRLEGQPRMPRGDPDDPLTDAEVVTKFHVFADGVAGPARPDRTEAPATAFDALGPADLGVLCDLCLSGCDKRSQFAPARNPM